MAQSQFLDITDETEGQRIHNFLKWANRKIEEELKKAELEDIVTPRKRIHKMDNEDKIEYVMKVEELRASYSTHQACKKAGISPSSYAKWKRALITNK